MSAATPAEIDLIVAGLYAGVEVCLQVGHTGSTYRYENDQIVDDYVEEGHTERRTATEARVRAELAQVDRRRIDQLVAAARRS